MAKRWPRCCGNNNGENERSLERIENESMQAVSSHDVLDHLPRKDYESLDYDKCFNKPYEEYLENQRQEHSLSKIEVIKWVITFLIGFSTGSVAFFIDTIVKQLSKLKFSTVDHLIDVCSDDGCLILSLLVLVVFNVGFVAIAAILTVMECFNMRCS